MQLVIILIEEKASRELSIVCQFEQYSNSNVFINVSNSLNALLEEQTLFWHFQCVYFDNMDNDFIFIGLKYKEENPLINQIFKLLIDYHLLRN